jgi:hypothetical protein
LARITAVEVPSARVLRGRCGALPSAAITAAFQHYRHDFNNLCHIVAVMPRLIDAAVSLVERHGLRAYDGVQLADTLQINVRSKIPLLFVSADGTLNNAAMMRGLAVEDPHNCA